MEMFLLHFFTMFPTAKRNGGGERGERGGERDNYQVAFYPKLYFTQVQNNSYHSKLTHAD